MRPLPLVLLCVSTACGAPSIVAPAPIVTDAGLPDAAVVAPDAGAAVIDAGPLDAGVVDAGAPADAGGAIVYPLPDWPIARPEDHGIDPVALETAAAAASGNGSFCLLVIRHGRLVFERYFPGGSVTATHPSWSIAKSYSSVLVGIALDRGELQSLDQRVSDFVPAWRGTPRDQITLRHLVTMTSGLEWSAFDDYVTMATLGNNHTQHALAQPLADPPGSKWTYNNEAVQVLEAVFRAATRATIEDYAKLHLWPKLGMSASWRHDPSGNPTPYANVIATCRDHARFGYLLLQRGKWNGAQVVSEAYLSKALAPSQGMNRAYGYLFWLNSEPPAIDAMNQKWPGRAVPYAPLDLFAARGFGNQFIDVIPSLDLLVIRFGTDPMAKFDLAALLKDAQFTRHDEILKPLLLGVAP